jgi:exosortase/archaeosortase family protein
MVVIPQCDPVCSTRITGRRVPLPAGVAAGMIAGSLGVALLHLFPAFEFAVLAKSAARLTALFSGSPVLALDQGFALPGAQVPVIVTNACSAADYFCIVAALISWQLARRAHAAWAMIPVGLVAALPLTIFVNALRISTVAQAHRWIIPLFPDAFSRFLHLTTGVAVFLPSLIALNFLLEYHGRRRLVSRR